MEGVARSAGNAIPVREESHLDDMRAAIRGDFERLQERRGEQELMRVSENGEEHPVGEEPSPEQVPEPPAPEPESEPELALEPELVLEPEPEDSEASEGASPEAAPAAEPEPAAEAAQAAEPEPAAEAAQAAEPEPPERTRSWIDRLLGR